MQSGIADLIFSQAVLEHVRKADFAATMRECRRLLKVGGTFSNQVDLQDHLGGSLNNLRFKDAVWESEFFARSGFYTNRIRFKAMLEEFSKAGFNVESVELSSWPTLPHTPKEKLAAEFQALPDSELCIHSFNVLLR